MEEKIEGFLNEQYQFLVTNVKYIELRTYKIKVVVCLGYRDERHFEIDLKWDFHLTDYSNLLKLSNIIDKKILEIFKRKLVV